MSGSGGTITKQEWDWEQHWGKFGSSSRSSSKVGECKQRQVKNSTIAATAVNANDGG